VGGIGGSVVVWPKLGDALAGFLVQHAWLTCWASAGSCMIGATLLWVCGGLTSFKASGANFLLRLLMYVVGVRLGAAVA
jgi:hypothetical protein